MFVLSAVSAPNGRVLARKAQASARFPIAPVLALSLMVAIAAMFAFVPQAHADAPASATCSECGQLARYNPQMSNEPTCTTDGLYYYECYAGTTVHVTTITVPATGHSWSEASRMEPTCTAEGSVHHICANCQAEEDVALPALGHSYPGTWTVERAATEQAEGLQYQLCTRCGNRIEQVLAKLSPAATEDKAEGDKVVEPAAQGQGAEVASGSEDGQDADIPVVPIAAGACVVVAAAAGAGYAFVIRPRKLAEAAVAAAKGAGVAGGEAKAASAAAAGAAIAGVAGTAATGTAAATTASAAEAAELAFSPKRNPKTILLALDENTASGTLLRLMRGRHFLSVRNIDPADLTGLPQTAADMKPDLIVLHLDSPDDLDRLLGDIAATCAAFEDATFAFVVDDMVDGVRDDALAADVAARLDALIANGTIMGYVFDSANDRNELVRLVLPLYKSSIVGDNALGALGVVADAMGIPGVAQAVDLFCNSREIKDIMASGDMSAGDKAAVIGDIASILGFEDIANVAEFIDNANTAKDSLQADEKNAGERAGLAEAGANIIGSFLG